ncbi:MAG TPA: hypothetical protein VG900_09290 [Hyphomicrobiaceae bacterium]|jgi:hypothetical protein|nr:hypothetical protein [Hyphomicrobiaceae bacterium]
MRILGRLILVPIAFVIAGGVALFVIFSLGQERVVQALTGRDPDEIPVQAAFDLFALAVQLFSVQTIVPALLLVIIGEVARIRGALYYVVGGGIALACVPLLARLGHPASISDLSVTVWQVLATAGFAGGFVFWLLAGRTA